MNAEQESETLLSHFSRLALAMGMPSNAPAAEVCDAAILERSTLIGRDKGSTKALNELREKMAKALGIFVLGGTEISDETLCRQARILRGDDAVNSKTLATTAEKRQKMIDAAVKDRMARGMDYDTAFNVVKNLAEFQPLFSSDRDVAPNAKKRRDTSTMDAVNAAVAKLQSETGMDYDAAWNAISLDLRFRDFFASKK